MHDAAVHQLRPLRLGGRPPGGEALLCDHPLTDAVQLGDARELLGVDRVDQPWQVARLAQGDLGVQQRFSLITILLKGCRSA